MSTVSAGVTITAAGRQAAFAARWRREHLFFTILPIVMAAAVFVGFSRSYYLKSVYGTPELAWLYHVHGAAFTTWVLLLILQPALVLARRTPLHRQVGWIAVVLVPVMTVLAWLVSVDLGRRGGGPPGVPSIQFLAVPMATIVVFPALVAAALYWRGKPEIHKRLMLIATLELVPAGFGRVPALQSLGPLGFFGGADLFVLVVIAFDLATRRRVHPATAWGGALLVATQVGRVVLAGTPAWDAFAHWAIA